MKYIGFILGVLMFLGGMAFSAGAKTAFQETSAAVTLLTGAVCIAVASAMDSADRHASEQKKRDEEILANIQTHLQATANTNRLLEKVAAHLARIEVGTDHTHAMLKWLGELQAPASAEQPQPDPGGAQYGR